MNETLRVLAFSSSVDLIRNVFISVQPILRVAIFYTLSLSGSVVNTVIILLLFRCFILLYVYF